MDTVIPRSEIDMARKKTEKPKMPATQAEPKMRAVRLFLAASVYGEFKVMAAKEDVPMATLARRVIEEYVASKRGKR